MSQRLSRSLVLTVDLYAPSEELARIGKRFQGLAPLPSPTITGARARIVAAYEASRYNAALGRTNVDQMDTTDRLRLDADTPCGDGWEVVVTGPADYPELGTRFRVQGGPRPGARNRTKTYLIVRATTVPKAS